MAKPCFSIDAIVNFQPIMMMKEAKEDYYSLRDVVSHLRSFSGYLRKRGWLLFIFMLLGGSIGYFYYISQKPRYEAVTTFILEEKSSGGNGLVGLASQFGFDMGGMGGGSIFSGDNILDILRSKKINYQVLLSNVNPKPETLADMFLNFSGWRKKWTSKPELKNISFEGLKGPASLSLLQDSLLNEIHTFIQKNGFSAERLNKKGSIIRLQITAANNIFARLMAERLVVAAAEMYLDLKTGTAQANIAKLQHRSDSLLIMLNRKSYTAAASQGIDLNPGIRAAIVPVEIATRDKAVLATLYTEVTKNLEASKLLLSQQTPIIQILDTPGSSLDDHKKSLPFILIVSPLVGAVIYIGFAFVLFLLETNKRKISIQQP